MNEDKTHALNEDKYKEMYAHSINDPSSFWGEQAEDFISFYKKWDKVHDFDEENSLVRWFDGAELNVSYNCIDRHVESGNGDQVAYHWEGNDGDRVDITYQDLLVNVSKVANVLKSLGVKKGDRICIYMPMIPEAVYTMLACTRIGAVHSVVFGGFSSASIKTRVDDAACSIIVTADVVKRGEKIIPLKANVDKIIDSCPSVTNCLVVDTGAGETIWGSKDVDYKKVVAEASDQCAPEPMKAEDPLFILYTSGSTGKPKGVLHTTAGYLLYASVTFKYVFDYRENEVFWCTADIGWITGHSYMVYGPLANRATSVLFEGVPTYPSASRPWEIVDKYKINTLYTAPTLIRSLMAQGDEFVNKTSRESLRILGTVGEPINPEAWQWYYDVVGEGRCSIVDTWWQTETGGHAIVPMPGVVENPKPGAAMMPFFGINPVLVDDNGNELEGEAEGSLLLRGHWPGQLRDLYNNHERFLDVYMKPFPGHYLTGDGARRDADGDLWITGRIDDTMKISGHLIGTAEVESAFAVHDGVSESAIVAIPHEIKGGSICAFVCLKEGVEESDDLKAELVKLVRAEVGPFAKPDRIFFVGGLPKTRSGKIVRRILRQVAVGQTANFGDTSTLVDTEVIVDLVESLRGKLD